MRTLLISFALVFIAVGCSAKADFEKACNAEQLSGAAAEKDPSQKAMKMASWIKDNVHGDVKKVFASLGGVESPDQRGAILKQAAHEAGYDGPCPLADMK